MSAAKSSSSAAQKEAKPAMLVALIATKIDCEDNWHEVSSDEGRRLARELGCAFYETSAKMAYGCDWAFDGLTRSCKNVIDTIPAVLPQNVSRDTANIKIRQNGSSRAAKTTFREKAFQRFKSIHRRRSRATTKSLNDEAISPRNGDLIGYVNPSLRSLRAELLRISQT